jgi:hypothetical protein
MTQQPLESLGTSPPAIASDEPPKDKKKKDKKKDEKRGIETMFRVTYSNHITLSRLADNKANMLIKLNGLIISAIIAVFRARLIAFSWDITPVLVLIVGCLISLVFAVNAARPRLSRTSTTVDDIRNGTGNLLFFGQFTSMPLPAFQEALKLLMEDRRLLYENLGRQLYLMGQALNSKYRQLQIAYFAFLAAMGLTTAAFIVSYFMAGANALS